MSHKFILYCFSALLYFIFISGQNVIASSDLVVEFKISYSGVLPSGTLFEVINKKGDSVIGLGMENNFQTSVPRKDGWLNLYVNDGSKDIKLERLGKGSDYYYAKLMRLSDKLVIVPESSSHFSKFYTFTPANNRWREVDVIELLSDLTGEDPLFLYQISQNCGRLMSISNGYAVLRNCIILANGNAMSWLDIEKNPEFLNQGIPPKEYLVPFFFSGKQVAAYSSKPDGLTTAIIFCPVLENKIDFDGCSIFSGESNEFPYATASNSEHIFFTTNIGNILIHDSTKNKFSFIRYADESSFQIYTAMSYRGASLLGEYPHGAVLAWKSDKLESFQSQIPFGKKILMSSPEVQALNLYRGDLYAGVWPWGQLWSFDFVSGKWVQAARLFNEPEIGSDPNGPYYTERKRNDLGQRIPSLVPFGTSLYGITSTKYADIISTSDFSPASSETKLRYGELFRLTRTGALSVPGPNHTVEATHNIRMTIGANKSELVIDGKTVGSTTLSNESNLCASKIKISEGLYGKLENAEIKLISFVNNIKCR